MKTLKIIVSIVSVGLFIACNNSESAQHVTTLEEITIDPEGTIVKVETNSAYKDSIQNIDSQISAILGNQETTILNLKMLGQKKDSVMAALNQVKLSQEQVNIKKIKPGIEGVNTKLAELKGQREDLQEQLQLQGQEIGLAEKKMQLLIEEKSVYDAQRKALWAKGAPPQDFVVVDSLLGGINGKISEQTTRLKSLSNSNVTITEQVASIDEQRTSLSGKIRNNYTAQQIFEEYAKEERERLQKQLDQIDTQISIIQNDGSELDTKLLAYNDKKNALKGSLTNDSETDETAIVVDTQEIAEEDSNKKSLVSD